MVKEKNKKFVILSGISIILVMMGHLDLNLLTFGGFLPYYSYHVMLFVFISGYFYNPEAENHILNYIKRKILHLLLPYAIWNVIYGLFITVIHKSSLGVWFGEDISFFNLLIAPFTSGHQYMLHAASWFVPALFLLQLCNLLGRCLLSFIERKFLFSPFTKKDNTSTWYQNNREYIIALLYFFIGFAVVFLAKRGSVYDFYKLPGRLMLMAPIYQLGRLYKSNLEKKDTLPSILYFAILFILQFVVIRYTGGSVNYSVVWVTGFANGVFMPYITSIIGIMFWLRIAKLLTKLPSFPILTWIGEHTFSIMMHHLFGFFLFNSMLYYFHKNLGQFPLFDIATYQGDIYYTYCSSGGNKLWYILYIAIGLFIAYILDKLAQILYRTIRHMKS